MRPLDLDHDLARRCGAWRAWTWAIGGGRDGAGVEGREHLVEGAAEVVLDDARTSSNGSGGTWSRHSLNSATSSSGNRPSPGGDDLAELDVGGPQPLRRPPQPAGQVGHRSGPGLGRPAVPPGAPAPGHQPGDECGAEVPEGDRQAPHRRHGPGFDQRGDLGRHRPAELGHAGSPAEPAGDDFPRGRVGEGAVFEIPSCHRRGVYGPSAASFFSDFLKNHRCPLESVRIARVNKRDNPYTPGAGRKPPTLAGRDGDLTHFADLVDRLSSGRYERSLIYSGLRGVGKTVLLMEFDVVASEAGWATTDVVEIGSQPDFRLSFARMASRLLREMSRTQRMRDRVERALRVVKAFSVAVPSSVGIKLDVEAYTGVADSGDPEEDLAELLTELGEVAQSTKTGALFLLDEMHNLDTASLSAVCIAFQAISRRGLPVALVGAGLPDLQTRLMSAKPYADRLFQYRELGRLGDAAARAALDRARRHPRGRLRGAGRAAGGQRGRRLPVLHPGVRPGAVELRRGHPHHHRRRRHRP